MLLGLVEVNDGLGAGEWMPTRFLICSAASLNTMTRLALNNPRRTALAYTRRLKAAGLHPDAMDTAGCFRQHTLLLNLTTRPVVLMCDRIPDIGEAKRPFDSPRRRPGSRSTRFELQEVCHSVWQLFDEHAVRMVHLL